MVFLMVVETVDEVAGLRVEMMAVPQAEMMDEKMVDEMAANLVVVRADELVVDLAAVKVES